MLAFVLFHSFLCACLQNVYTSHAHVTSVSDDMDVNDQDEEDEESLEEMEEGIVAGDDDSDEESYSPYKKAKTSSSSPRKSSAKKTATAKAGGGAGAGKKKNTIRVTTTKKGQQSAKKKSPGRPARKNTGGGSGSGGGGKGRAVTALNALAKKVIKNPEEETPTNSIVAALLKVHNVKNGGSIVSGVIDPSEPRKPPRCLETSNINPPSWVTSAASAAVSAGVATSTTNAANTQSGHLVYTKVVAVGSEVTPYSKHIEGIARYLIRNVADNGLGSNSLHISLMNLIFRCVGGTYETNVPEDTQLDELSDDEFDSILNEVVDAMTETADEILVYAKLPTTNTTVTISNGTGPYTTHVTKMIPVPKIGPATFRDIYKEFWYRLGTTILNYTPHNAFVAEDDDDSDGDGGRFSFQATSKKNITGKKNSKGKQEEFSSNRFQLEMARDLVERLTELTTVTQPDIRMASTLAIYQIAQSCLERTVELEIKIQTSERQYKAAKQQKSSSKMETIKTQIDTWRRHKDELEDLIDTHVFRGAFSKRYRDSNASIREESLKALQKICVVRPDIFLNDAWLKYFGWMASDLDPHVRLAALEGLLAPFIVNEAQSSDEGAGTASTKTPFPIDITNMRSVTMKFLDRITDSLLDVATEVPIQETAIKLLNNMLLVGFLDDWEVDEGWDQINLKAIDVDASPLVRRDALYFVLDQLEFFDAEAPASGHSEEKQEEQLQCIAAWYVSSLFRLFCLCCPCCCCEIGIAQHSNLTSFFCCCSFYSYTIGSQTSSSTVMYRSIKSTFISRTLSFNHFWRCLNTTISSAIGT